MKYAEKLKDPRWQKLRLKILERDKWTCQMCGNSQETLCVHHRYYIKGKEPWEYPKESLVTLCEECHEEERTSRPEFESILLQIFREKFLYWDAELIANAFRKIPLSQCTDVFVSAFVWTITNPKTRKELIQRYIKEGGNSK